MKAAIVQSDYIPWSGFFKLISDVDVFIFFDDVQWTKRDWRNRNRVRTPQGWCWLTIPVKLCKPYYEYKICEVQVDNSRNWQEEHLKILSSFYKKAPYYNEIYTPIKNIFKKKFNYLVDVNYELIFWISDYLNLKTKFLFSQEMHIPLELKKTDRLICILEKLGNIKYYFTGPKAKSYIEENKFIEKQIKVIWNNYNNPYYNQNTWKSNLFISNLSILDLLFNHGKESSDIIINQKKIEKPEWVKIIIP